MTFEVNQRNTNQGVRESAWVPQFVMLCRRWAQLQCFAGRTGRTAGCCVAGKRAQYRKIRPFPKNLRSQILGLSPYSLAPPHQPQFIYLLTAARAAPGRASNEP